MSSTIPSDRKTARIESTDNPIDPAASRASPARYCRAGGRACDIREARRAAGPASRSVAGFAKAVRPLWQDRSLARKFAIAGDHIVHAAAWDKVIIVDGMREVGRQRLANGGPARAGDHGGGARCIRDRNPLDPHRVRLAGGELQIEIMVPRVPVLSPAIEHLMSSMNSWQVARAVEAEAMEAAASRRNRTTPS